MAGVLEVLSISPHGHARHRVEACGGLVEEEDARIMNQATRDLETPPHAAGERLGRCITPLEQVHRHQQVMDVAHPFRFGNFVELGINGTDSLRP